jgi:hypothetical protein
MMALPVTSGRSDNGENNASSTAGSIDNGECNLDCEALNSKRIFYFGGDLMDRTVLLQLATQAREKVIENIKKDYGIYFEDIFKNGFEPITQDGDSIQMLRQKIENQSADCSVQQCLERNQTLRSGMPLIRTRCVFSDLHFDNPSLHAICLGNWRTLSLSWSWESIQ